MDAQRRVLLRYLVRQLYALRLAQCTVRAEDQQHQARWLETDQFELIFADMPFWQQRYHTSRELNQAAKDLATGYRVIDDMARDAFEAWYRGMKHQIRQIARDTFRLNQDS